MMRVYICPDCGWMRMVSRRKNVECYKCGVQDMTLAKVDFATYVSWSEKERQEYARLYNAGLKNLSLQYKTEFADYYPAFTAEDGRSLRRELSMEGLHPNVFGYDKMAEILKSNIDFGRFLRGKEV